MKQSDNMERIDFYILQSPDNNGRLKTVCQITEKAYLQNHTVFIHTLSQKMADDLNIMLWTFKEDSFIPHTQAEESLNSPITIGYGQPPNVFDILINLDEKVPSFYHQFNRIIEVISNENHIKEQGRAHYKYYKEKGYDIHTHQLNV